MATINLTGRIVPFLLGMPSIRAVVIGISPDNQYILQHDYDTQTPNGEWIHVTKTYYRDKDFINRYWLDNFGLPGTSYDPAGTRGV